MNAVSCALVAWPRLRLGVQEASRLGFDGCESFLDPLLAFDGGESALRDFLGSERILLSSAYADVDLTHAGQDAERRRLVAGCRLLRALGADRIVVSVAAPVDHTRAVVRGLDELGRAAAGEGVTLCVHPHARSAIATAADLTRVLAETDRSVVSLCADTGELLGAGLDPASFIRDARDRVGHVHLKDVARDGSGAVCELGAGLVDLGPLFGSLDAIGYCGWLVVEMEDAASPTESVRACVRTLARHGRWKVAA